MLLAFKNFCSTLKFLRLLRFLCLFPVQMLTAFFLSFPFLFLPFLVHLLFLNSEEVSVSCWGFSYSDACGSNPGFTVPP